MLVAKESIVNSMSFVRASSLLNVRSRSDVDGSVKEVVWWKKGFKNGPLARW